MTEIADLQISAFVDDELSHDECEFLVRRLSRDPDARRQLLRFETIGAAVRGELLAPDPDVLRRRIGAALEGVHLPARPEPIAQRSLEHWRRPAIGAGIAASVAVAALLAVSGGPADRLAGQAGIAARDPIPETTFGEGELLPSFVVATDTPAQSSITLTDYIVQHNQFTPAIRRASINSTVVGEQHSWRAIPAAQPVEQPIE